ncbi:MAG: glutaredoxin family protein [Archaeoglobales archaeon]|jgi:glutaredoxin|nr:glutaredoxin family protein [Archaeoglobi archaeon]NHW22984.1 glutaredoxin family protein [Archaeoglobales archaeon]TDA26891.1 MAG: glutaredoxin family protein [Archaeoglobi archaeon]TDA29517.1 MAG: glutaredoxin family protein [Archaeoglobi archaeon]
MAEVVVYGLTTCPHCKRTLDYLKLAKVDFEVVWIDKLEGEERDKAIEEVYKLSKSYSVPLVVKGDKWVLGFDREKIDRLIKS